MSESTESKNPRTFQATATAIGAYKLVQLDANEQVSVQTGTTTTTMIGATKQAVVASGYGSIELLNAGGSFFVTLTETATVNDALYPKGDGFAGVTVVAGMQAGIALQNGVAGDVVEALKV